jgi:peptide/nickel transport system substrate-binding protein
LDPKVFAYGMTFRPPDYVKGNLALSWEMPDTSTFIVHLRQGIHWQNIPPVNGREFTSDDVVWNFDRMYGLGGGFTKPSPFAVSDVSSRADLTGVTATDKYTVVFKWRITNPEYIQETMLDQGTGSQNFVAKEAVAQWGDVGDWHHAIGTGPFIIKDYVSDGSATLVKNPDYWAVDERYPQNKLPYVDKLTFLIITNAATNLAAMRTAKIDLTEQVSLPDAQSMKKTNPEIVQLSVPQSANGISFRVDKPPFNDINVRRAMQMAIDLPTLANTYYQGTVSAVPDTLTSYFMTGWGYPYEQWSQSLKDEYKFDPVAAKKLLSAAGYPNGFKTDVVADSTKDMDLMQIVASNLSAIGVTMEIRPMDAASWVTFVLRGHNEDAMAFRSGGPLGNSYSPIRMLQLFRTGYPADFGLVSDPVFDAFYPAAMNASSVDAIKKIVADANKMVAEQHYALSLLQPDLFSLYQPWLKGYNAQTYALSNVAGFYTARYWIDSGVKKSFGH